MTLRGSAGSWASVARTLRRQPLSAAFVIAALSLGSAATITVFSLMSAVFLEPLAFPEPGQLVRLQENHAEIPARTVSYLNFRDWEATNRSFAHMATYRAMRSTFSTGGQSIAVDARQVTAAYFDVLGLRPQLGRGFTAAEDVYGAPLVAIVSHALWQTALGADPAALGRDVLIDGETHSLVGIAPPAPTAPGNPDVWVMAGQRAAPGTGWTQRDNRMAGYVLARLADGVTLEEASADMERIGRDLARQHVVTNADHTIEVVPLSEALYGDLRMPALVGFGAVVVLLLIVCVNASNLLLIRATVRSGELALRAALGAGTRHLVRQALAESMLFAVIGTGIGAALAIGATRLLAAALPAALANGAAPTVGIPVVVFSVALMIALGLLTGLPPALRATSGRLGIALVAGARSTASGGRARDALAVLQIALALTLLVCGMLLAESMTRLQRFDYGFDPDGVLTFRVVVDDARIRAPEFRLLHSRMLETLEALPGVRSAAIAQELPGFDPRWQNDINPESPIAANRAPGELINVDWAIVSERYFETLHIPIASGRVFTEQESVDEVPVMLVDEKLARRFWPDGNALGKHVRYDSRGPVRIVGVARDVGTFGREDLGRIKIYTPYGRFPLRDVAVMVRTDVPDPQLLVAAIRAALPLVDARLAMYDAGLLTSKLGDYVGLRALTASMVVLFASLASILAVLGIYAVVSYATLQRKRELTIRAALGAPPASIVLLLLRKGLVLAAGGIVLGLAAASAATRTLSSLLFGVTPTSPSAYAIAACALATIAVVACAAPAWRARGADPALALRND
jgi:putative ABC transport system permease protein